MVDNSITAGATRVWVDFQWAETGPIVAILDDAHGMHQRELLEAMRIGSEVSERRPGDLGRFGLGLKTASFSQCKVVTVATKHAGQIHALRWDLDYVANVARDWHVLVGPSEAAASMLTALDELETGTLVVWERLDHIVSVSGDAGRKLFLETADAVKHHLALVFHRFLSDNEPRFRIAFGAIASATAIKPVDPFLLTHPATWKSPTETLQSEHLSIEVQAFVLPHRDRMSDTEYEASAGRDGWTSSQGFYVYRNRRLLVWGTWLSLGVGGRLWTREEAFKLARIRLDIDSSSDFEWAIDIKKSSARAPACFRPRLRAIAAETRERARSVLVHRGAYGPHRAVPDLANIWLGRRVGQHSSFVLNRQHPLLAQLLASLPGATASQLEAFVRMAEMSVPIQRIWLEASDDPGSADDAGLDMSESDLEALLARLYDYFRRNLGLSPADARDRCLSTDPLHRDFERVDAILQSLQQRESQA